MDELEDALADGNEALDDDADDDFPDVGTLGVWVGTDCMCSPGRA